MNQSLGVEGHLAGAPAYQAAALDVFLHKITPSFV
jgi:hypothetical protein